MSERAKGLRRLRQLEREQLTRERESRSRGYDPEEASDRYDSRQSGCLFLILFLSLTPVCCV